MAQCERFQRRNSPRAGFAQSWRRTQTTGRDRTNPRAYCCCTVFGGFFFFPLSIFVSVVGGVVTRSANISSIGSINLTATGPSCTVATNLVTYFLILGVIPSSSLDSRSSSSSVSSLSLLLFRLASSRSLSPSESLLSLGSTSEMGVFLFAGLSDGFSWLLSVPLVALVPDGEGGIS